MIVEDNGPGIVEGQIARIFGKLLYGSKFHKLSQSRGQQGMGISAAGMYGQLTVGKPLHIISRVKGEKLASEMYVSIDTAKNQPDIHRKKQLKWDRPHGTRVEMEMEGHYQKGPHSVEVYLKQTAIANPHLTITYKDPQGEELRFARSIRKLPAAAGRDKTPSLRHRARPADSDVEQHQKPHACWDFWSTSFPASGRRRHARSLNSPARIPTGN